MSDWDESQSLIFIFYLQLLHLSASLQSTKKLNRLFDSDSPFISEVESNNRLMN